MAADLIFDRKGSEEIARHLGGKAASDAHYPSPVTRYRMEGLRAMGTGLAGHFAFHVDHDPFDGTETLSIFTDDGRGNGDEVLTVDMADLEAAMRKSSLRRNGVE